MGYGLLPFQGVLIEFFDTSSYRAESPTQETERSKSGLKAQPKRQSVAKAG